MIVGASYTLHGIRKVLDAWNGFDDEKVIVVDEETFYYKYGDDNPVKQIIYRDLNPGGLDKKEFEDDVYYIDHVEIDNLEK